MNASGYPCPSLFGSRFGSTPSALALAIRSSGLTLGKCQQHGCPKFLSFNTIPTDIVVVGIQQMKTTVPFSCSRVSRRIPMLSDETDVVLRNLRTRSSRKQSSDEGQVRCRLGRPEFFVLNHASEDQPLRRREDR
jgi:hypothetical protein